MKSPYKPDEDYEQENQTLDEAADSLATIVVCLLILAVFGIAVAILWFLS